MVLLRIEVKTVINGIDMETRNQSFEVMDRQEGSKKPLKKIQVKPTLRIQHQATQWF